MSPTRIGFGAARAQPKAAAAEPKGSPPSEVSESGASMGFPHHHAAAGKAFEKGDVKTAMHHVGHMIKALKSKGSEQGQPEEHGQPEAGEDDERPQAKSPFGGLRSRLAGLKAPAI